MNEQRSALPNLSGETTFASTGTAAGAPLLPSALRAVDVPPEGGGESGAQGGLGKVRVRARKELPRRQSRDGVAGEAGHAAEEPVGGGEEARGVHLGRRRMVGIFLPRSLHRRPVATAAHVCRRNLRR